MSTGERFACPACGFRVFSEEPGSYEICGVCGWEDDHVQLGYPTLRGGANGISLVEAQAEALGRVPLDVRRQDDDERDPTWRPLEPAEIEADASIPRTGREYFAAAVVSAPRCYWQVRPLRSVEAIVDDINRRAVDRDAFRLWVPTRLSLAASEVPLDVGMAVIVDRLLHHGLFPDGFEDAPGGRVYRYRREGDE